jgi:twinkle protein
MSGTQIDALPHSCGSRTGLKVFLQDDGSVDGYCFRCGVFEKNPYGEEKTVKDIPPKKQKTAEEIQAEIAEVDSYPTVDVPQRKLRGGTLEYFGAKTSMSEKDGTTPTAIYWPVTKEGQLTGYHVKVLDKSVGSPFNIGDTRNCDFLNWENAKSSGAYRLIITEGPEDMASIHRFYEMYGDKEFMPAVVSLPHGAASVKKTLTKHLDDLKRFKDIVFCFDNDEAGQIAVEAGRVILPRAKSVTLPTKDANMALVEGKAKAAYNALAYHATIPKNSRIVLGEAVHDKAREPPKYGEYTWPFPTLDKAMRGLRLQQTIYIGAGVKMGKGELRNEIAAHLMKNHDAKIFMASPEEPNEKTYKLLAGKLESKFFHDPDKEFDYEAFDRAGELLKKNLALVNVYQNLGWDSLRQDMVEAANWGAKVHFIDPITNLTNGVNSAEANTMLQEIAQEISALAMDLNIAVFMFCHLKAPDSNVSSDQRAAKYKSGKYIGLGNCPHEMGGDVISAQFAGSRAMMRSANLMIGLEGNKDPDLPENERNMRVIRVLEDREFGTSVKVPVFWNKDTGRFIEA